MKKPDYQLETMMKRIPQITVFIGVIAALCILIWAHGTPRDSYVVSDENHININDLTMPRLSTGIAPYLDIPAIVERPDKPALKPYFAMRAGMRVRYTANIMNAGQPELMWVPRLENGRHLFRWQSMGDSDSGILGLYPGNQLDLIDNKLYDFGLGTLLVRVANTKGVEGYILLETLVGDMEPDTNELIVASDKARFIKNTSVLFENIRLYEQTTLWDENYVKQTTEKLLDPTTYATTLNGGTSGGIHPVFSISTARILLFQVLRPEADEAVRARALKAVEKFADAYLDKERVKLGSDLYSWPYKFEWTMNWGIKLTPPWYSPYANSQAVTLYALLYRMTGKEKYAIAAREAVPFIETPIDQGGSEYQISGFRLPAEYVYSTPPLPNVRVLDGEFVVAIGLYNAARLLGDSHMLRLSLRYFASLAMQMEGYARKNGDIWFAKYIEDMPPGYRWSMWSLFQSSAIITKDRRFSRIAQQFEATIPESQCSKLGC